MTEDVLVSVPSVLVWCCWVGGVMYLEECEEGESPRSTFFPPPPRVSMLQPRLVPAFFGCETSGIYMYLPDLTCINRALFPVPRLHT